jgi:drug/metabolite transporter (DMT)-like permease
MPLSTARVMGVSEWSLLILLSILWGGSFFFFKILVAELPTLTIVLGRVLLAGLVLNLVMLLKGNVMPRSPKLWGEFFVMGFLNNVLPFVLLVWAETRISSSLAAILNATTPVFSVLAGHFLTADEKLNWSKGFGVLFGLLGVLVLMGPSILAGAGGDQALPQIACLATALIFAVAGIYGRRFSALPSLTVATGQITASTVMLIPVALLVDVPWNLPHPSAQAWQALLGLAILSTALAYIIYFYILARAGATNVLLVTLLVPVSAIFLGGLFLSEAFTPQALAGMLLIGVGLIAIDGRLPTALRNRIARLTGP